MSAKTSTHTIATHFHVAQLAFQLRKFIRIILAALYCQKLFTSAFKWVKLKETKRDLSFALSIDILAISLHFMKQWI
jgi:hypothetical protein